MPWKARFATHPFPVAHTKLIWYSHGTAEENLKRDFEEVITQPYVSMLVNVNDDRLHRVLQRVS